MEVRRDIQALDLLAYDLYTYAGDRVSPPLTPRERETLYQEMHWMREFHPYSEMHYMSMTDAQLLKAYYKAGYEPPRETA